MSALKILSGGAAQGLVGALAPAFERETGLRIEAAFGAVGTIRDRLIAGEPADLAILTATVIGELAAAGLVLGDEAADLGTVETAIAVRAGDALPALETGDALRAALLAADAVYVPDTVKSTAGLHLAGIFASLGLALAGRLREHLNGAAAMRALAEATEPRPIGATQVTEILATPGLALAGPLPPGFGLATVYTAAPVPGSPRADAARTFILRLSGPDGAAARREAGFGP